MNVFIVCERDIRFERMNLPLKTEPNKKGWKRALYRYMHIVVTVSSCNSSMQIRLGRMKVGSAIFFEYFD